MAGSRRKLSHPFTGATELVFGGKTSTLGQPVHVRREARYKKGQAYWVDELFAVVRYVHDRELGSRYIVSRKSFGEERALATEQEAVVYIEALYALEVQSGT
jgi:hypothetical protein